MFKLSPIFRLKVILSLQIYEPRNFTTTTLHAAYYFLHFSSFKLTVRSHTISLDTLCPKFRATNVPRIRSNACFQLIQTGTNGVNRTNCIIPLYSNEWCSDNRHFRLTFPIFSLDEIVQVDRSEIF